jgi:hypothetical protein
MAATDRRQLPAIRVCELFGTGEGGGVGRGIVAFQNQI